MKFCLNEITDRQVGLRAAANIKLEIYSLDKPQLSVLAYNILYHNVNHQHAAVKIAK